MRMQVKKDMPIDAHVDDCIPKYTCTLQQMMRLEDAHVYAHNQVIE